MFASLHNHTYASNLRFIDSINRPELMVEKAIKLGFKGLAITDHESLSVGVSLLKIRDKIKAEHPDFKIIFGNEIYLIPDEAYKNTRDYYHFILLAKDEEGYRQLRELSSRAWGRSYFDRGIRRCPTLYSDIEQVVKTNPGHIAASSACFTAGHMVLTADGEKKIEEIVSGDRVVTLDGHYHTVVEPTSREYKGDGYHLSFRGGAPDITCTEDHLFYVFHRAQIKHHPLVTQPRFNWKPAKNLKVGDICLEPLFVGTYSGQKHIDVSSVIESYEKNRAPYAVTKFFVNKEFDVTPMFMRMFGLWLGDGYVSDDKVVGFTLNLEQKESLIPIIRDGLKVLGNFNLYLRERSESHRLDVEIHSVELAKVFSWLTDNGKADTKKIPLCLKHISQDLDAELLFGYLLADGYYRARPMEENRYISEETVDATVSRRLFDDITDLYHSVGFVPGVMVSEEHTTNGVHHKKAYYHTSTCSLFSANCNKQKVLDHSDFIKYIQERVRQHSLGRVVENDGVKYLYHTVKSSTKVELNEKVYCMNVEGNHSFLCNHVLVHNCLGGELDKAILARDSDDLNKFIPWCISCFGKDNFSLEMQVADSQEQIVCNQYIMKLSEFFGVRYIITTDSHYLDKEDFPLHTAFLNSKSASDRETESFYKYTYIMSEEEMYDILAQGGMTPEQVKKGLDATVDVCDSIQEFDFRHSTIVPEVKVPDFSLAGTLSSWYDSCPAIKTMAQSESLQNRYMLYLVEQGIAQKHYVLTDKVAARLNEEFDVILYISGQLKQDISAYLNLVKTIVDICWEVSYVGVSRGSAGAFLTNYLMGITQLDPLKYNIPSFRFLNKARADALPDVDIDVAPEKKAEIIELLRQYFGEDNVLNCATFKTESLKAAIIDASRGMGINNDEAQALAALVPAKRGITYTLKDCLEGNPEQNLEPVSGFADHFNAYPGLLDTVRKIEDLPVNASIHASAVYIFNEGYLAHNSLMTAPNGTKITAFDMHDSDDAGALKFDLLLTDAESKLMKTTQLLLRDKKIEWKGSLRETYNAYLHPDVLHYDNKQMWENAAEGRITNLFQMETLSGMNGIRQMRPQTVEELAAVNGLIRLTGDAGSESPVERYARFKANIQEWYDEMTAAGLTQHEQDILKRHLSSTYGLCYNQEAFMLIVMDPEIGGFTLKEADKGRKILSKKIISQIADFKQKFLDSPASKSPKFKQYVWDKMIAPQMLYSFNLAHGIGYSLIGVQEMNLATYYDPLYWTCGCLCINAGTSEAVLRQEDEGGSSEESTEEEADSAEAAGQTRHVAPNYEKITKAISDVQLSGVNIELPDINKSDADFVPDEASKSLLYGLKGITAMNEDLYQRTVAGRPYTDFKDYYQRVIPTKTQMIGLIKAGCFDSLMKEPRIRIMNDFLVFLAENSIQKKTKIGSVQIRQLLDMKDTDLSKFETQRRIFRFRQYLEANQNDKKNGRYLLNDADCIMFFRSYFENDLNPSRNDFCFLPTGQVAIKKGPFKKVFDEKMAPLTTYLNSPDGLQFFYNMQVRSFVFDLKLQYCTGSISSWEFETLSFYKSGHVLQNVCKERYGIRKFDTLPENDKNYSCCMAGTVAGTDNMKHIVNLLTPDGMVVVKFISSNDYIRFNQRLSKKDPATGKKTVVDDSWFKRGNNILVYGRRRENVFLVKTDRSSGYARTVALIEDIYQDGSLNLRYSRKKVE